jgi:uncharacterized protein with NAD-binding domain and iron-sulfur cluster
MSGEENGRSPYRERGIGYERYATDLPGPYTQSRATMAGYIFRADRYCLQGVVNHYLGDDPDYHYFALPMVVLTLVDLPKVFLTDNPGIGHMHEVDGGYQIACISVHKQTHALGISLFMPYLWVNTGTAMATGREVLGFRKDVAISFSDDDAHLSGAANITHVRAWVTPAFGEQLAPGYVARLLRGTGSAHPAGSVNWPGFVEKLLEVVEHALPRLEALIKEILPAGVSIGAALLRRLLSEFEPGSLTVAFLKQVRDSQYGDRTCFQATFQAPSAVRDPVLQHLGWGARFEVGNFASHPIADELGMLAFAETDGTYVSDLTFQTEFDLLMGMQPAPGAGRRKKVAILGGGPAALAAMMDLSKYPERFQLTLYQVGWRLGGKCSSGRGFSSSLGAEPGSSAAAPSAAPPSVTPPSWLRNEEHGLHMALGFYENFFDLLRQAYDNLNRSEEWALRKWTDAVSPRLSFTMEEQPWPRRNRWEDLALGLPTNRLIPGDRARHAEASQGRPYLLEGLLGFVQSLLRTAERIPPKPLLTLGHTLDLADVRKRLRELLDAGTGWVEDPGVHIGHLGEALRAELHPVHQKLATQNAEPHDLLHWPFLSELSAIEVGIRFVCGIGALLHEKRGFSSLDGLEFSAWLDRALAFPMLPWTRSSTFLRTCYLLPFAYEEGDSARPLLAAGAGARALLRILADYAGAISYDFRAGMAECAIVPMYQTILRRSPDARFEFFSRVRELKARNGQITEIHIGKQATTRDRGPYQPLVPIDRIECFPAHPLYDQLEQGAQLQQGNELLPSGYDLESNWTEWPDVGREVLKLGQDFDLVILAIPPPAAKCLTRDLEQQSPAWGDMLRNVTGVPTLGAQFWLTQTLPELGWTSARSGGSEPPLILGYAQPLAALAEMSEVLQHEPWTGSEPAPRSLLYLCGPMQAPPGMPGCSEPSSAYIEKSRSAALEQSLTWTEQEFGYLFPNAVHPNGGIKWSDFASPLPALGSLRFEAQYFRANTTLSELYITSFPGTIDHRLPAAPADFGNLYLAGDWVKNNLDIGSLEGAILSGRMAARAILGLHYSLYGERDPLPWTS